MSLRTSFWLLPQNEHRRVPLRSLVRAIGSLLMGRECGRFAHRARRRLGRDDFVAAPIFPGLLRGHEKVAVGVALAPFPCLSGVVCEDAAFPFAYPGGDRGRGA